MCSQPTRASSSSPGNLPSVATTRWRGPRAVRTDSTSVQYSAGRPGAAAVGAGGYQGLRVERLRSFGDVFLGLALWRRLELDRLFRRGDGAGARGDSVGRRWPAS